MSVREYKEPRTLEEAQDLAQRYAEGGKLLAGGTALVLLMRQKLLQPEVLINLRKVPELGGIEQTTRSVRIGATVTHDQAARSELLKAHWPALVRCFAQVATPRIRHAGTVGGNLVHGDPHLDPPVALLALDVHVHLQSTRQGERELSIRDFFVDYYQTVAEPDEILSDVRVPQRKRGEGLAFLKFLPRSQDDYATVDLAVWLRQQDGSVEDVRIALGSVGPTVFRAAQAEAAARSGSIEDAARLASEAADPEDDVRGSAAYKRQLIRVLLPRVYAEAVQDASRPN
ncbi:MAG TPA: xanthine dehydrogenase family protein subunit M [Chloroflexota bacterium]|nr:xanthine dehydrogenase family protein subunit M [Chloroflexota bacterium]